MRVILACLLFAGLTFAKKAKYNNKYDKINLDEILNNERLYQRYFRCLTNKGSCTSDAKELKGVIPGALRNSCAKCNEKHLKDIDKVIGFMAEKKRDDFAMLEKIYDPKGIYMKKYRLEAEKRGIKFN